MVALIRIKRSANAGAKPSGLVSGELAVNTNDKILYIGTPSAPILLPAVDQAILNEAPWLPSPTTNWRSLCPFTGAGTTIAMTAGRCLFIPFVNWSERIITDLGIEVSASSAGTAEVAIYAPDGVSQRPGSRLAYVGSLDTGTTGVKSGVVNVSLMPGLYWAAVRCSAAATLRGAAGSFAWSIAVGGNNRITHLFNTNNSLADPVASDPTSLGTGTLPHIYARW